MPNFKRANLNSNSTNVHWSALTPLNTLGERRMGNTSVILSLAMINTKSYRSMPNKLASSSPHQAWMRYSVDAWLPCTSEDR